MVEGRGERVTGTPNTIYDLSSVLFHALEGGASYDRYIRDAEEAGDRGLSEFFSRLRDEDSMRADEARRLLADRTPESTAAVAPTKEAAASASDLAPAAPRREEAAGAGGRYDEAAAPATSITELGQRGPDAPPLRPEEPPPPGTGVRGR